MTSPDLSKGTAGAPLAATDVAEAPVSVAATDFANDVGATGIRDNTVRYIQRLRGGDMGALPALAGLVVLVIIFSQVSGTFLTKGNIANLLTQASPIILLAMGLVFVLLLGEIDLSAGTLSGVTSAVLGLSLTKNGDLHNALGTPAYLVVLLGMVAAALVAGWYKIWPAVAVIAIGIVLIVTSLDKHAVPAIFVAIAVGCSIGTMSGVLVAKVGIPSFVVTLALFLGWQGVTLKFIGQGGAIDARSNKFIFNIENSNFSPLIGWVFWIVAAGGYLAFTAWRAIRRRSQGLTAEPLSVVLLRGGSLAILSGVAVWFLNSDRSKTVFAKIDGIPKIVPVVLVLLVIWTIVLSKTSFGRHLYAVGGNAEAARRAGIDVNQMKVSAFIISSGMAAFAGVALASRQGSIDTAFGGGNTLLYAVAAAVIGGTSLFGGKGKVRDAVIGGLVIAIIPNGLGLVPNLSSSYVQMITAGVLLLAASVDAISRKRTAG